MTPTLKCGECDKLDLVEIILSYLALLMNFMNVEIRFQDADVRRILPPIKLLPGRLEDIIQFNSS